MNASKPHSIDKRLLAAAQKVTAHRAKTVINHIIQHGFISTEELKETYGYNHPPRAAGDVRDQGIPLETFKVVGSDGRKIAAYRFGDPTQIENGKLGGRKVLPKTLKNTLIKEHGTKCAISMEAYDASYLQIDHRIPYRISGDDKQLHPEHFMLLSGAAQRQKSWACEHCNNFLVLRQPDVCQKCYWAFPESHEHIAMKEERRIDMIFSGSEIATYQSLKSKAEKTKTNLQTLIKSIIQKHLKNHNT